MTFILIFKFLLFLLSAYIWGRALLARYWTTWWPPARLAAGILAGWHLLALVSLVLGLTGLFPQVYWLLPVMTLVVWWSSRRHLQSSFRPSSADIALLIVCGLATFLLSRLVTPFGLPTPQGLYISGAHFIDSTWHLSLIHQLVRSVPPDNPIFAGVTLFNYHYLVDLQLALVHIFTGIAVPVIFFRLAPWVIFACLSLLIAGLCTSLTGKKIAGVFGVLFLMVGSNLYYLAPRFFPAAATWPSVAWVDVYSTLGVNYPLTISLGLVCVIWLLLQERRFPILKLVLLSSTLVMVKSHTALVLLAALGFWSLITRNPRLFFSSLLIAISTFGLTFLIIGQPAQSLTLAPFWFIRTMFTSPERLNYPTWELARQYLLAHPGYLGLTRLYAIGLAWFTWLNLGPLLVGLLSIRRHPLVLGLFAAGFTLTMAFIYTGTAIVTIQFFYLAVFALSVGTAVFLARLPRLPALLLGLSLWLAILPGVVYTQNQYHSGANQVNISASQLQLAETVAAQSPGSQLIDPVFRHGAWFTAYSGHSAYLGDFQTLPPLALAPADREATSQSVLLCTQSPHDLGVKYLVTLPDSCWHQATGVNLVFTNASGSVFSVL